jgi:23S rRNA (guanosine2251-2'-O)-methyltransferase
MNDKQPPEDMLYGRNPVREALRKGRPITRLWLSREEKDRVAAEILSYCHQAGIPYKIVDKPFMDRLCGGMTHQGFAAQAAPKEYRPWQDMLDKARAAGQAPLLVLLDGVEDPHNLGAVLRSLEALGGHGAVIPKHRAAPLTGGVARASAGAWEYVLVDRVTNLSRTIDEMKDAGLWVMGAAAEATQTIYQTDWTGAVALVLGGEDKGISPLIRTKCDMLVSIPMQGQVNSLNVSAAAAVILAEISRQRSAR